MIQEVMKKLSSDFSPNNKRLNYPVYGEFGFAEPVGRKKYEPRPSPIHKLIFNTDLPPITREEYQKIKQEVKERSSDPDNPSSRNYHRYLRARSIAGNNFSSIYSPEEYKQFQNASAEGGELDTPQKFHSKQLPKIKQLSEREQLNKSVVSNPDGIKSERSVPLKVQKFREDSLDSLMKPLEGYDVKMDRKKERVLDQIIRHRSRNPTYLNSQF